MNEEYARLDRLLNQIEWELEQDRLVWDKIKDELWLLPISLTPLYLVTMAFTHPINLMIFAIAFGASWWWHRS